MGNGIPAVISRHSHPRARPEAAPPPAPTGIDYLGLLAARRDAELAESINYAQLSLRDVGSAAIEPGSDDDTTGHKEIQP
jgi:hypothetical protein